MKRKILHVDIDAFFASVEQLDNPSLKGKPVIVGGTGQRGVVATCSYEARRFGVHSAMSTQVARRLCPQGIFINGRHERYRDMSQEVFRVLWNITDKIEKISIDEAYLDISNLDCCPMNVAKKIKEDIKSITGLTISVGISYNKFLAKLASDWDKPDGIYEIKEEDVPEILKPLSILKVHGLGKKTASKLNRIGIFTIEDLLGYSVDSLCPFLGESRGIEVYHRIRGLDNREVITNTERKSYGRETTFLEDVKCKEYIIHYLKDFTEEIVEELRKSNKGARTVTIKIKYEDFEQITRSQSMEYPTNDFKTIIDTVRLILGNIELHKRVRLVGVSLSNISDYSSTQLSFLDTFDIIY